MGDLTPILPKLEKLIPLLSSDKSGEVFAAVSAIDRVLKSNQCDWHDLTAKLTAPTSNSSTSNSSAGNRTQQGQRNPGLSPSMERRKAATYRLLSLSFAVFGGKHRQFVMDILPIVNVGGELTERQTKYLSDLCEKHLR